MVHMCVGYLKKKSRQRKWQERWFQATGHYLTYFKVRNELYSLNDMLHTLLNEINVTFFSFVHVDTRIVRSLGMH